MNKRIKKERGLLLGNPLFLVDINRCTVRKGDAIGRVEGFQVYLVIADAQPYRHDGSYEFAVLARIERGHRQFVPTFLRFPVYGSQVAHLPDNIVGGFVAEPRLQHVADAEPLILTSEEAPRALQPAPEHHEAFLIVFYVHHFCFFEHSSFLFFEHELHELHE